MLLLPFATLQLLTVVGALLSITATPTPPPRCTSPYPSKSRSPDCAVHLSTRRPQLRWRFCVTEWHNRNAISFLGGIDILLQRPRRNNLCTTLQIYSLCRYFDYHTQLFRLALHLCAAPCFTCNIDSHSRPARYLITFAF